MFGSDSTSAPMFNWIRGEIGINTLSDGSFGEDWMRGKIKKKHKKTGDEVVSELRFQLLSLRR